MILLDGLFVMVQDDILLYFDISRRLYHEGQCLWVLAMQSKTNPFSFPLVNREAMISETIPAFFKSI
jgi:hypothetical protein